MSKIVFPAPTAARKPYRGFYSRLRDALREAASQTQDSPASKAGVVGQINALFKFFGTTTAVSTAQTLTGVTPTGTYVTTVTFTVAGGVITAIALS